MTGTLAKCPACPGPTKNSELAETLTFLILPGQFAHVSRSGKQDILTSLSRMSRSGRKWRKHWVFMGYRDNLLMCPVCPATGTPGQAPLGAVCPVSHLVRSRCPGPYLAWPRPWQIHLSRDALDEAAEARNEGKVWSLIKALFSSGPQHRTICRGPWHLPQKGNFGTPISG